MVGAEGGLADGEGLFVLGAGAGQVALSLQQAAEVAAECADDGVVGAEGDLADGEGLFVFTRLTTRGLSRTATEGSSTTALRSANSTNNHA